MESKNSDFDTNIVYKSVFEEIDDDIDNNYENEINNELKEEINENKELKEENDKENENNNENNYDFDYDKINNNISGGIKEKVLNILDSEETQQRLFKSILFNPIAKQYVRKYPPEYDLINTYDYGLEHINDVVKTEKVLDEQMLTNTPNVVIHFKLHVENVKIFGPGTVEHKTHSYKGYNAQSPNDALKNRLTYCALLMGDVHYSYEIINPKISSESKVYKFKLENAFIVNIPIPIGSKYCILNQYDPLTLIRTGEDMEGVHGFFIIRGFIKFLIPYYNKPYNSPIILRNDYDDPTDNQLARMECLYLSSGLDYENSYYVLASIIRPKTHIGRGVNQIPILDFVFSLQMNDKCMNKQQVLSRRRALINIVPIKYLFFAFGCSSDYEMIKYICPDENDSGLIHTIRQACLRGKYHIAAANSLVGASTSNGYLKFDTPLDTFTAKYIVGHIILSDKYKAHIKKLAKTSFEVYKREVVKQVDRLLREKFMPGVGKDEEIDKLYELPKNELTDEERERMAKHEILRNRAICFELGQIVRDLYKIGNNISPSMDKISLLNRRPRHGQQIINEFKSFWNARLREINLMLVSLFSKIDVSGNGLAKDIENHLVEQLNSAGVNQSASLDNAFKGTVTKDKSKIRTGLLDMKNQTFFHAKLREIVISTDTKARGTSVQWEHRVVHPSHMYFIDPVFCPESGPQVGRYQQPTIYTYLTTGSSGKDVKKFIKEYRYKIGNKETNIKDIVNTINDKYIIKLNGSTIGYIEECEPVEELYEKLMEARRNGTILRDCSVVLKHQEGILDIWTDEGRMVTIFVEVKRCFETKDGKIQMKQEFLEWLNDCKNNKVWNVKTKLTGGGKSLGIENLEITDCIDRGLEKGFITLYDPAMTVYNCCVAQSIDNYFEKPWLYNTIALPLHILSYPTSIAMCINMNAGVRGSYASNHMKQSMGPTFRYPQIKYINEANVLLAPQLPLCRTCMYDIAGYNEKPMGNNIVIAFLTYCDNQEDSVIVNRSSIEDGFLIIDSYTVKSSECTRVNEQFGIPNDPTTRKIGNVDSYLKLDPKSALPRNVGDKFYTNDVLIAKFGQYNPNSAQKTDHSVLNDMPDACNPREANSRELRCVNKDIEIDNNTKEKMVVMGQRRCGIAGDKFNSCNAQKCTIGAVYDAEKMPYTKDGIRVDILFNQPSISSRGTCGQIYEAVMGKLAALLGCPIDITPYQTQRSIDEIIEIYKKLGLNEYGFEYLYDPESGRCMGKAFVGVMQYQRQQHLVENKLNIRAIDGDMDKVSGLAVKGRKRNGGQSIDRMTVDAINASGAVLFNLDTHLNQGAKMTIAICGICHKQFTYYSNDYKCWSCACCGRHNNFIIKEVVPAENLINHIFAGMALTFEYKKTNKRDGNDLLEE